MISFSEKVLWRTHAVLVFFWDSFVSAVDENQTLSDDKFIYPKTLVEGTAATTIRGLPSTADNCEAAKNI